MTKKLEISVLKRDTKGTGASRRLRRAGKVPAVIYGAGKDPDMVALEHDALYHLLENEAFHTSILTVKQNGSSEQAILRDVQYHPHEPKIIHLDLQRISAKEKIHMQVPIHFIGADITPGVKQQSGIVSHLITEVDISCLASQLPEYLEADISELNLGESLHLSDIKLPEGVGITSFVHGGDNLAVVTIAAVRGSVEDEEAAAAAPEGEEAATEGEGEEAEKEGE